VSDPDGAGPAATHADADLNRRFGGLARLYGDAGAQRIRQAHAVIVGVGGVGSWAAEALARSGLARLTLVDLDHISESNINRQVHALGTTVGQSKVQAMRERISHIHPGCEVRCIEEFVDAANWPHIALPADHGAPLLAVIDACDQVRAKTAMAAWALSQKRPGSPFPDLVYISVGAAGGKRMAHKVDIDDLALLTHDPLLAQMRYRLRKEHGASRKGTIGLTCVYSREAVTQPGPAPLLPTVAEGEPLQPQASDSTLNCHGYGSVVSVTATFGMCAAGWALGEIARDKPKALKNHAII
jgi:tRNA threonylcarbamoyladenosine dehydratase